MATTYTGLRVQDTYNAIIKIGDNSNLSGTAKLLSDGLGNDSPLYLSGTRLGIGISPAYQFHTSGNAKIGGNLIISGNLTVNGTLTYLNVTDLQVEDPLIKLAKDNTSNTLDIGFFGKYVESATTKYTGLFWDASTDKFRLYEGLQVEPTTTVDVTGTGYTRSLLNADLEGNVTGTVSSLSNHDTNDLVEGSVNQYFTTTRARASFTPGTGVTITNGEIAIGQAVATDSNVTFGNITGSAISGTTGTFSDDVNALRFIMNPSYAASAEYLIIRRLQNQDGGILLQSKTTGGVSQSDWQILNHGSTNDLRFYAYGLADFAFTLDRETGNATFSGQVTIPETPTADAHAASKKYVDDATGDVDVAKRIEVTVKNVSGGSLAKGVVVHAAPTATPPSGNVIEVVAADANVAASMPAIGVLNETIADEAEGEAVMFGAVSGIDTSSFSIGDELYVSETAGEFTATKPTAFTSQVQKIAVVIKSHASNGLIKVFGAGRANDIPNRVDRDMNFTDDSELTFGDSSDLKIYHTTNNIVRINSGDLIFNSFVDDGDIKFQLDDGSDPAGLTEYMRLDGGVQRIIYGRSIQMADNVNLYFGNTVADDANIKWDSTAEQLFISGDSKFLNDLYVVGESEFTGDVGIGVDPVSTFHIKYSGGSYGADSTSGFINQATTGRATQRLRSITDSAAELFFDIDGGIRWDISARASDSSYALNFYPAASTPVYNNVGAVAVQFSQAGDITSSGNGIFSGRLELNDGVTMTGGWRRTAKLSSVYPVLVFQSTAGTQKFAGIGYDSTYGTRFWKGGTGVDMIATASNWMSVPDSGTIEINQATRFSDFIRVDAGTTGNPIGGITWSSTDNGFLYANAGGVIKAKIDSANDSYLLGGGLGIGTNSIAVAGTNFLGLHIKNTLQASGSSIVLENNAGHKGYIYTGTSTDELAIQAAGALLFNAGATNKGRFNNSGFSFQVGVDTTTSAHIRLGGGNAAGGRLYIEYNGDSSYIDSYGGHGSTVRYRDLSINARNLYLKTGTTITNTLNLLSNGNVQVSSGTLTINATNDSQLLLTSSDTWCGISFNDGNSINENIFYNGTTGTFAIGGGGSNVANKKLHIDGGVTIGVNYDATAVSTNSLNVEGSITSGGGFTSCGSIKAAGELVLKSSDCSVDRAYWSYDDNANQTYLWNIETDAYTSFYTSSTERLRIKADGVSEFYSSVGIGGTPSGSGFSASAFPVFNVLGSKPVVKLTETDVTDSFSYIGQSDGNTYIGSAGSGSLFLQTGASSTSNRVTIDNTGNVTINESLDFVDSPYRHGYSIRRNADALIFSGGTSGFYFNRHNNSITDFYINGSGNSIFNGTSSYGRVTINQGGGDPGLVVNNTTSSPPTLYLRDAGGATYGRILCNNNINIEASNVGINHTTPFNQISGTETTLAVSNSNVASLYLNNTASGGHNHIMFSGTGGNLSWYDKTAASYRMILFSDGTFGLNLTNIIAGGFSPTFALKQKSNSTWGGINIEAQNDDSVLAIGTAGGRHKIAGSYRASAGYKPLDIEIGGQHSATFTTSSVGIKTNTPQSVLDVYQGTGNNQKVSFGGTYGSGYYQGIHFGYFEKGNTSYRKSAIVFERTDLTSGNAQGKVHILNGPQSGAGSATLADAAISVSEYRHVGLNSASPISPLHLKYSGGSYGTDATSGFINQADTGRSTTRLRSIGDEASELFFDIDGAIRWDISARPSAQGYDLNFYRQAATPVYNNVSAHSMSLKQNGNVHFSYRAGFNTASPDAYVHVNLGAGGSNGTDGIRVNGLSNYPSLGLGISGNYHAMVRTYGNDLEMYAGHWRTIGNTSSENHSIRFYTSKSGSSNWSTAKMTLDHYGMLEVNGATILSGGWGEVIRAKATYPGYTFNSNNSKWAGIFYDYTWGMRIYVNGSSSDVTSGSTPAINISNAANIRIGDGNNPSYKLDVAGTIRATSDVIAFSDKRVKENIKTVDNALNKVTKLRGVTYTRKDTDDKSTKIGVIAQEVLEVLPEVVSKDENDMYSVAYGNMAGVFIEAIKELKAEVDSLKQEIKELKK